MLTACRVAIGVWGMRFTTCGRFPSASASDHASAAPRSVSYAHDALPTLDIIIRGLPLLVHAVCQESRHDPFWLALCIVVILENNIMKIFLHLILFTIQSAVLMADITILAKRDGDRPILVIDGTELSPEVFYQRYGPSLPSRSKETAIVVVFDRNYPIGKIHEALGLFDKIGATGVKYYITSQDNIMAVEFFLKGPSIPNPASQSK